MAAPKAAFGARPSIEFVAGAPFLDRDSCKGDSGGPAYVAVKGGWAIAGATSRATRQSDVRVCGDGGIYTRLYAFSDWIKSVSDGHWKP
jgi:secreted trypsin-like serine protease